MAVPADHDAPRELPAGLTPAQAEAVLANDPVLAVLAGAGTGKTRVLTLRVARRVKDRSAEERHVLVCTFSRKAADELEDRLFDLGIGEVSAGTFHRTAWQLIQRHRLERGLPDLTLLADRRGVLGRMVQPPAGAAARRAPPPRLAAQLDTEIGWAKARMVEPGRYEEAARRAVRRPGTSLATVAEWYERYQTHLRRQRALDLDDLLTICTETIEDDPRLAAAVHWRFRHLFVDEMQDVNPAQFRLLESLLGETPDLFVVGDPKQSIYAWNGADPTLLDRLPDLVPGTRVLRLEENHRCTPQVVAVAAAALGLPAARAPRSTRPDGPVPIVTSHETDADEAAWVARQAFMAHRPGTRWSSIAVLARTNAQLGPVVRALEAAHVPYRFAGGELAPASDLAPDRPPDAARERDTDATAPWGSEEAEDPDGVVLSTFHRAKGLQWPTVFVVGAADGLVPLRTARRRQDRDEERRLLYVALTRAERELTVSWARWPADPDRGNTERAPSPWLEAVERSVAEMAAIEAPARGEVAAAHLAAIRRALESGSGTLQR